MRKWIQETKIKKGTLSKQLGIPIKDVIPITLLQEIKNAKIDTTIRNPTKKGKSSYRVTPLLKKRSVLALNLKRLKHK